MPPPKKPAAATKPATPATPTTRPTGRDLQRYRTRKDILRAAAKLIQDGGRPSMEEVAAAAMVGRATLYRYFPNIDALLMEASVDIAIPDTDTVLASVPPDDPVARVDALEAMLHGVTYANEIPLRHTLAAAIMQSIDGKPRTVPLRQNRRLPLIEAALAPVREQLDDATYTQLCASLALVFGLESMIVFRDVHPLSPDAARATKRWMIDALVTAALASPRR